MFGVIVVVLRYAVVSLLVEARQVIEGRKRVIERAVGLL
jgi:hypothetical protein